MHVLTAQWGGDLAVMKMLRGRWKFHAVQFGMGIPWIVFMG
jgi:hypothetical protein